MTNRRKWWKGSPAGWLERLPAPAVVLCALGLSACTSIPVEERPRVRRELVADAIRAVKELTGENPKVQEELDSAVGYLYAELWQGMLGYVGTTGGLGLLHDLENGTRTYVDISTLDLGAGLGGSEIRFLAILDDREDLDRLAKGKWLTSSRLAAVGGDEGASTHWVLDGMSLYLLSQAGANLGATVSLTKVSVNDELTDQGISDRGLPTRDFKEPPSDDAPRVWPHALPFLAQEVIDKGYDLPLPYGVTVGFVDVKQNMTLTGLSVGINGSPKREYPFVSFDNARTDSESKQVKLDTWLFPFMNVFGIVGDTRGKADLDVVLDGNTILETLGNDCSGLINPLCDRLEDQQIVVPVRAMVDVSTYGVGTVLAGGWNDWFVALPLNVNYVDPAKSVADGLTYSANPRVGRLFDLGPSGRFGSLALFVGGSYLRSELELDGDFTVPETDVTLNYTVEQANIDRWAAVCGFNWNLTRRIALMAEYDGFVGSRESWITMLTYRF